MGHGLLRLARRFLTTDYTEYTDKKEKMVIEEEGTTNLTNLTNGERKK